MEYLHPSGGTFIVGLMALYGTKLKDVVTLLKNNAEKRYHRLVPIIKNDNLVGIVPWQDVTEKARETNNGIKIDEIMIEDPVVAYSDESLREVSDRKAIDKVGAIPVVERGNPKNISGLITQYDLLAGETRELNEEYKREQILHIPFSKNYLAYFNAFTIPGMRMNQKQMFNLFTFFQSFRPKVI